jgi:hypothetical protein
MATLSDEILGILGSRLRLPGVPPLGGTCASTKPPYNHYEFPVGWLNRFLRVTFDVGRVS